MTEVIRKADLLVTSDRTVLDRPFYNKRFSLIADALNGVGSRMDVYDVAVQNLIALGLQRIDDTLGPLLETLQDAQQLGFLMASADGVSISLTATQAAGFVITEGGDLFTPTPYLLAQDRTDSTNWGLLELIQYTKSTGDLATTCVYASKTQASTQWTVSANSAVLPATMDALADAVAAKDLAEAAVAEITAAMATLEDLIEAIEQGPVASVAGRTGAVVLALADVVGLVDALASKATITYVNSGLAGKQNTSALLNALAGLSMQANKMIYAVDAANLATATITPFARTLIDDANATEVLATLGISSLTAFAKTLLDDENIAAARATLGITEFMATLLDDADIATLRSTLSITAAAATVLDDTNVAAMRATLGVSYGKQTIWLPGRSFTPRTTNGATSGTAEMTTNKNMAATLDFSPSVQQFAQADVRMPKSWDRGTVSFIPVWSHPATTTNFGVVWGMDAVAISDNETLDVAFGTPQVVSDLGGTTNRKYEGAESPAITIAGSPATGDMVQFRIHRDPANGGDTLAVNARLHGVVILYTNENANDT